MTNFEHLPQDPLYTILHKVSSTSCADLSSVRASSSKLLKSVKNDEKRLYKEASIVSLTQCDRWANANIKFIEKCVDHGNLEAQYWYGLWLFLVHGEWGRAKKPLKDASDGGHVMATYVWCLLTILHSEKSDPDLLPGLQMLDISHLGADGDLRRIMRRDVCMTPITYVPKGKRAKALLTSWPMYCENPTHFGYRNSKGCDNCLVDEDAAYLMCLLWSDSCRVTFLDKS